MSADNGIYILKTKDGQCRVIEAMAIDNLHWSFLKFDSNNDLIPTRIVEYFGKSKYTRDINKARSIASKMADKCWILEYGINEIYVNNTWKEIISNAKRLAKSEIDAINERKHDNRWDYDIKRLEEIIAL